MSKSRKSRVQREKAKHRTNMCKIRHDDNVRFGRRQRKNSSVDDMIADLERRIGFRRF